MAYLNMYLKHDSATIRRLRWSLWPLFVMLVVAFMPFRLSATTVQKCRLFSSLEDWQKTSLDSKLSIEQRQTVTAGLWSELELRLKELFQSYIRSAKPLGDLSTCFQDERLNRTLNLQLNRVFLNQSIAILKESGDRPYLGYFNQMLARYSRFDSFQEDSTLFLSRPFQLRQSSKNGDSGLSDDPRNRVGGYHRGKQSVFLNPFRIKGNEWFVYVLHELLHMVDPALEAAVNSFNDKALLEKVREDLKTLSADSADSRWKSVDEWLLAGLSRGLLAEHRTWLVTILLYEELVQSKAYIERVEWLSALAGGKANKKPQELERVLYVSMDRNFFSPKTGFFAQNLLQRRLEVIRTRLRKDEEFRRSTFGEWRIYLEKVRRE